MPALQFTEFIADIGKQQDKCGLPMCSAGVATTLLLAVLSRELDRLGRT